SPRECATGTPPRMRGRPSPRRCVSCPLPMRYGTSDVMCAIVTGSAKQTTRSNIAGEANRVRRQTMNESNLTGRVAIVTGASRGIGRAIALGLAKAGWRIVVAAKSTESTEKLPGSIHTVAAEVEALGSQALAVQVDVRDEAQIEAMAAKSIERFGRIDILINNAGALFWKPLLETPARRFDLVMSVNARAACLCSRAVLPSMIANRWGHIIN